MISLRLASIWNDVLHLVIWVVGGGGGGGGLFEYHGNVCCATLV